MKWHRRTILTGAALWLVVTLGDIGLAQPSPSQPVATWKAAAVSTVITPAEFIWMSGYGSRDQAADGKLTELYAKALVLEDAQARRVVMISLDLIGIDRTTSQAIARRLLDSYGLERSQIMIATSHTHTGPAFGKNLHSMLAWRLGPSETQAIESYTQSVIEQVVSIVGKAIDNLQSVELMWGTGESSIAVNRRRNTEEQVPELRAQRQLQGPSDYDVPVLAVQKSDGQLMAVCFGYACHATVLSSNQWSGDYPGFAQLELETRHPGCIAIFWAGCGADQNPLPRRTEELARHYGRRLADAVDDVLLTSKLNRLHPTVEARYAEIDLEFAAIPDRPAIENEALSQDPFLASRARLQLRELDAGKSIDATYPYPVATWKFGDQLRWVALGGEVVVDYALRLKKELGQRSTWVTAYANDVMAYIPSKRILDEGGYEGGGAMVYYGLPSAWAPAIEERIIEEVRLQLR